jgi:hypothetical protein
MARVFCFFSSLPQSQSGDTTHLLSLVALMGGTGAQ